jgi:hypothetical protein
LCYLCITRYKQKNFKQENTTQYPYTD